MVALLQPVNSGKQIPIDRAVVLIGRSPDCDFVLDTSTKISRLHCALIQVDNTYFIRDLGSMNGVWVNGDRVENERQLKNNDAVSVGDVEFQFLENGQFTKANSQPAPQTLSPRPDQKRALPKLIQEYDPRLKEEVGVRDLGDDSNDVIAIDDVEVLDDVSIVDEDELTSSGDIVVVKDLQMIEESVVPDDVEVIDEVEVLDDIEVIEDVEVVDELDDLDFLDDSPRRPKRRPRR